MSSWVAAPVALLLLAMLASAARKVRGARSSVELRTRLGVGPRIWSFIGALEGAAAVGLVLGVRWSALGLAAATGVAVLMLGAVVAHLRAGLKGRALLPPTVLLGVAVTAVVGLGSAP